MKRIFSVLSYNFTIDGHISRFEGDVFKLPKFQRGFVWTKEQALLFADSLVCGYPLSSLTFAQLDRDSNDMYVLDGQQRILSMVFLKYGVFPTEQGRVVLRDWFLTNPVWRTLRDMFKDKVLFEEIDTTDAFDISASKTNAWGLKSLPSVELAPSKNLTFEEYWTHIKECFKRLNLGGTSLSEEEIEQLLNA